MANKKLPPATRVTGRIASGALVLAGLVVLLNA
jgi:hypothetical protein